MQENNKVWIFDRKPLVAFVVAVLSALGTLVGTLSNTAQINTIKNQNVHIEQQMRSVSPVTVKVIDKTSEKQVKQAEQKADKAEQHAAEVQKENKLLKRQVPNVDKQ